MGRQVTILNKETSRLAELEQMLEVARGRLADLQQQAQETYRASCQIEGGIIELRAIEEEQSGEVEG